MIQLQNDSVADELRLPYLAAWALTAVSASVSVGYSIAGLVETAGTGPSGAPDTFAMYAASRSVALLLAALTVGLFRSPRAVVVVALAMTVVQALDAIIGGLAGDALKTWGPAGTAVGTLVAAIWLWRAHARTRSSTDTTGTAGATA